ncbi:MAG: hypothetical protein K9H64_11990 [Bacteroidales bacterium]|nr:hypothetical protein [Bacteroidales bacterium]MCF8456763.1 hypothetical protein [Bacteroidales bacterium]
MTTRTEYWEELLVLAAEIKELEPWGWMYESDIFGVEDPVTGIVNYVSIMGNLGEHYSVSAYMGEEGLKSYIYFNENHETLPPETILEMPQLMLSFEYRDRLQKEDYELIKKSKLKFRGSNSWPLFKQYSPGFLPYTLEPAEQRTMLYILQQAIEVAKRFKDDEEVIFHPDPEKEDYYMIRKPETKNNEIIWTDTFQEIVYPSDIIQSRVSTEMISSFNKMPLGSLIFAADLFILNHPTEEPGHKVFFPYLLLLVEKNSRMVVGTEMLTPMDGFDEMLSKAPETLLKFLLNQDAKPKKVQVQSERLFNLLEPLFEDLIFISLELIPNLGYLKETKDDLMGMMGG